MKTIEIIAKLRPCAQGAAYLRKHKNLKTAWKHCQRGDWMLWLAAKVKVPIKTLTLAKGLCANTVRHLMKDERSIAAVDAAIAFGRGKLSEEKLKLAASAAYATAYASAAFATAYAASAAAYASAAFAADTDATAYATAYAAYATKKANQQQTADICREILTKAVMEEAERGGGL